MMEQAETCFVLRNLLTMQPGLNYKAMRLSIVIDYMVLHFSRVRPRKRTEALFIEKRGCSSGPKLITRRDLKQ